MPSTYLVIDGLKTVPYNYYGDVSESPDSAKITKPTMFQVLPVELVEKILLYLTVMDIYNFFQAFGRNYNLLSDHFWRKICMEEDFLRAYQHLEWFECFENGIAKVLGNFVHCQKPPVGKLEHVYSSSIIVSDADGVYNVYNLNSEGNFEMVQSIPSPVYFRDEFVITQSEKQTIIYRHNWQSNQFDACRTINDTFEEDVFGISNKYCTIFQSKNKLIKIHSFCSNSEKYISLPLPEDVKILIEKRLHNDKIVISAVTFTGGYRIKTYDISKSQWVLDLKCFSSTGITNDPNVWVGDNFIACCDVSYRLRGIYFGPFKVWNKHGEQVIEAEIDPSNHHFLRCFFKERHVLLTTSDDCIKVFDSLGRHMSSVDMKTTFQDVKISTGYLLFVLMNEPWVEIHNWKSSCHLHSLSLTFMCYNSLLSEFLYCPQDNNKYEVFILC